MKPTIARLLFGSARFRESEDLLEFQCKNSADAGAAQHEVTPGNRQPATGRARPVAFKGIAKKVSASRFYRLRKVYFSASEKAL